MKKISLHPLIFMFVLSLCLSFGMSVSAKNLFSTVEPINIDGKINVIVETPAGSTTLRKINIGTGFIVKADTINYLAIPFNVGVVPATTHKGNPLQVVLLSEAAHTGSIQKAYAIGIINCTEQGIDKKIVIAVGENSPFNNITNLELLNTQFPGVLEIIQTWYTNAYAGKQIIVDETKSRLDAVYLVGDSILEFANANIKESNRRPMDKDGNPTLLNHPASKNIHK